MISQKVADERVKALALVSLPVESFDFTRLNSFPGALLLVAGSRDWLVPRDRWEALATSLRREADFETVYGADHSWWGYESELEGIAGNFLARHLAGTGAEEEGS
jgi:dienelactone hydrolase